MSFIDIAVSEHKGGSAAKFKLKVDGDDLLNMAVAEAITKYLRKVESDELTDVAMNQIKYIACNGFDIADMVESPRATLQKLNSRRGTRITT